MGSLGRGRGGHPGGRRRALFVPGSGGGALLPEHPEIHPEDAALVETAARQLVPPPCPGAESCSGPAVPSGQRLLARAVACRRLLSAVLPGRVRQCLCRTGRPRTAPARAWPMRRVCCGHCGSPIGTTGGQARAALAVPGRQRGGGTERAPLSARLRRRTGVLSGRGRRLAAPPERTRNLPAPDVRPAQGQAGGPAGAERLDRLRRRGSPRRHHALRSSGSRSRRRPAAGGTPDGPTVPPPQRRTDSARHHCRDATGSGRRGVGWRRRESRGTAGASPRGRDPDLKCAMPGLKAMLTRK